MFEKEIYAKRRSVLRSKVKSGIILLPGNSESPMNYPSNTFHFRQDSTFLYYFGLNQADFVGVIDIESDTACLYGDDYSIDDIIWMGNQPSIKEHAAKVGIGSTYSMRELHSFIKNAIGKGRHIHFLPTYRAETTLLLESLLGIAASRIKNYASEEMIKAVVSMREIKSVEELDQIDEACNIGYEMFTTAMKMTREGIYEREIAGAMEGVALTRGAGVSFHCIVTQNGETLHNHYHGNKLKAGRMLLMDAGAQTTLNYCSDFSRTIPVSGKFSPLQRDIYTIVVNSFEKAMSLVKPDILWRDIHLESCKVIVEGLKDMGLMKGDTANAVESGAHAMFMPCGLGHQMGMDVHDMEGLGEQFVGYNDIVERSEQFGLANLRMGKKIEVGHVMTVEPGIYIIPALIDKWEKEHVNSSFINFDKVREIVGFGGARIEDDIVVTSSGKRILGNKRIPYQIKDIENIMDK